MVGEIKRNYLSGTKLVTEKRPTWRDSGINEVVNSVAGAVEAGNNYFEREKQLVWKRLNLEAANLQTEELNSIRTAKSIEEIPGIVENFQKKLKENMRGQKWGKEWMENLGSGFLSYNKQDVQNAFRAKEKELAGISLNETLKAYADQIAAAPEDEAAFFSADADKLIDADTYLTPTEKQKAKENFAKLSVNGMVNNNPEVAKKALSDPGRFPNLTDIERREYLQKADNLLLAKEKDRIAAEERERKEIEETAKDELGAAGIDYTLRNINSQEALALVNKYKNIVPNEAEKLLNHITGKTTETDNPEILEQLRRDVADNKTDIRGITMARLKGEITSSTADELIKRGKALYGWSEEEKAGSPAQSLLQRARAGEDMTSYIDEGLVTGTMTKTQADRLEGISARIKKYAPEYQEAIEMINTGGIVSDFQITNLDLGDDAKTDLKNYLAEKKEHESVVAGKLFDDYSKLIVNSEGSISETTLKALPGWKKMTSEQQDNLLQGAKEKKDNIILRQQNIISGQINSGAVRNISDLSEKIASFGWGYEQGEMVQKLQKELALKQTDAYGVYSKAIEVANNNMGSVFSQNKETTLELEIKEKVRDWIYDIYMKGMDKGVSPTELAEELSPEKVLKYVESVRPSVSDILSDVSGLDLTKENLEMARDAVVVKNKKTEIYELNENAGLEDIFDFRNSLDAFVQNGGDRKTAEDMKKQTDRAFLQKIAEFDNNEDGNTTLGNAYRAINLKFGNNLLISEKAALIQDIGNLLKLNGIRFDDYENRYFGGLIKVSTPTENKDGQPFDRQALTDMIVKNVLVRFVQNKNPGLSMAEAMAVVNGTDIVKINEMRSSAPAENTLPGNMKIIEQNGQTYRTMQDAQGREYIF